MSRIEVSYSDLEGIDTAYVEKLREKEEVVRQAIAKVGRSCAVRWVPFNAGPERLFFRLTAYSNRADCIAQFSPLDLTFTPEAFEKLILEGKRPCA